MLQVLNKINGPKDLKQLTKNELIILASEIREVLINKLSKTGGHVGPNLGIVEATIALHYIFNSPIDKIVFDVSHQCYTHKILTGRKECFINKEKFAEVSGYTNPEESEHDLFRVGHTSTSISMACGLAKARDIKKENYNVIAIIGDGALSGGEAYEGLNNAAELNSNIIIVVNDNEMSISENHGGLYRNLELLRSTNGEAECNIFKALGFEYHYIENGNNVNELVEVFSKVKDKNRPIVVHVHTKKGKGLKYAEEQKEKWHNSTPFDIETGEVQRLGNKKEYKSIAVEYLLEKIKKDKTIVAVTAGNPGGVGFTPEFRNIAKEQFIDVGITEEHAISFVSAMAKNGLKPVFCVLSSFIQRTYDQLSQDLCINKNPAVIIVTRAGISNADITHLNCFDIPLISNIPNMVYLAPTTKEEYMAMLDWGLQQDKYPVAIRVSRDEVIETNEIIKENFDKINTYKIVKAGKEIAIIGLGNFYWLGDKVRKKLKEEIGIEATLINPRYISGTDKQMLENLKKDHKMVVTLEDGVLAGGFGEKIARFYGDSEMKVLNFGARKEFTDREPITELYNRYHLTEELIVKDIILTRQYNKKIEKV